MGNFAVLCENPRLVIFFQIGSIYTPINDRIVSHLTSLINNENKICINISCSENDEYEIKPFYYITLDRSQTSMLLAMYALIKEGQNENKTFETTLEQTVQEAV